MIRILLGCEESGEVRDRLTAKGFDAVSCDLQPSRQPGKHYQGSIFDIINDGFDVGIFFPPCTHLARSGAAHFEKKRADGRQQAAINFFMAMINAPMRHIAVENPVGIMSSEYRPPDQIIHPYYFGDEASKQTCLWLKNLPKLFHAKEPDLFNTTVTHVGKGEFFNYPNSNKRQAKWCYDSISLSPEERSKARSKIFPGIAQAMADQWGDYLIQKYQLK